MSNISTGGHLRLLEELGKNTRLTYQKLCELLKKSSKPQIDVEHRTICDLTTDTWHYITVVYIDGVKDSETTLDSNIPCSEPLPFPPDIEQLDRCDDTTKTIHTDVIRYVTDSVTNVTTSSILSTIDTKIECNQNEIDKIVTNWLPICVEGVQWYVTENILFNNSDQSEVTVKLYKQGANGSIVLTPPLGIIKDGYCVEYTSTKVIQGDLVTVAALGTTNYTFGGQSVSDIMITNLSNNIIKVKYNTVFSIIGNGENYCAYGQTITLNLVDKTDLVNSIAITDITGISESKVIINSTRL